MSGLLRAVRQQRGMTLEELAEATGLTKSYLSKVERQRSTPSIAVAMKVAQALEVDVAQLFSEDPAVTTLTVDRAGERPASRYHAVATAMLGKSMSPFIVRPTLKFADHPHPEHAGQELVFVHAGTVEVRYQDELITLQAGDCAYFDASLPHQLRQRGSERSEVLVVTHHPPRR
ncbi:helix-turn-helix domain-containing protein [Mycolicibacterium mageritense]|uniref:HTH-type transcriptional regulator SutR n=1 Tax=Mycolicibacterium mageritense TaxID=53462 RepID=A0AAI8TT81_MYCME|nr:XRE family transcriptional regulator [Mycolicibacterium mageritense]TXI58625.1 MAG: XRE family transcriptional regulator [Mycolicibacterium mageritense]BDY30498.1 HTH-type transcriptional regulator SutR [Mycolicibacterium mageritense]